MIPSLPAAKSKGEHPAEGSAAVPSVSALADTRGAVLRASQGTGLGASSSVAEQLHRSFQGLSRSAGAGVPNGVAPAAAAPEGRLEKIANSSSPCDRTEARIRRSRRQELRESLWQVSRLERVRQCGRRPCDTAGVAMRLTAGVAGWSGLATCSSVWSCPVCNAKVMAERANEISTAVRAARDRGFTVGMVTLTMRHRQGQALADLWGALSYAWGRATSGKAWKEDGKHVKGFLRVVEVTHGDNGWHVHLHVLVVLDNASELDRVADGLWRRWKAGLIRKGLDAPLRKGQDWHVIDGDDDQVLGEYLAKAVADVDDVALELTSSQTKELGATRSPWLLLKEWKQTGDRQLLALWNEYELASHGRRHLTWSHGLRQLLELGETRSDEEIATQELGTVADTVVMIPAGGWAIVCARQLTTVLLDIAEINGVAVLLDYLQRKGIPHEPCPARAPWP